MRDSRSRSGPRLSTLLIIGWMIWFGFIAMAAIVAGTDPQTEATEGELLLAVALFGVVAPFFLVTIPMALWSLTPWSRPARLAADTREALYRRAAARADENDRLAAIRQRERIVSTLPNPTRAAWRRLQDAHDVVRALAADGHLAPGTDLRELDTHMDELLRLLEVDRRTDRLGGATSSTVRTRMGELTALLVGVADAAIEHRAVRLGEAALPDTLTEARDTLAASTGAYRELNPRTGLDEVGDDAERGDVGADTGDRAIGAGGRGDGRGRTGEAGDGRGATGAGRAPAGKVAAGRGAVGEGAAAVPGRLQRALGALQRLVEPARSTSRS